jgi:hypothetical protein
MAKRARAFCGQFQLSTFPAHTLGDEMKTLIALFASLLLAASASAEIKSIDIKIFGMD